MIIKESKIKKLIRSVILEYARGQMGRVDFGSVGGRYTAADDEGDYSGSIETVDYSGTEVDVDQEGGPRSWDEVSSSHDLEYEDYEGVDTQDVASVSDVDPSKLKTSVDLDSVAEMAQATGLRPDFIYGIQSQESQGKYNAMALNPHITIGLSKRESGLPKGYVWASSERDGDLAEFKGGKNSEGFKKWAELRKEMVDAGVVGTSIYSVQKKGGFTHPMYVKMKEIHPELAILGNAMGLYQVLGGHLLKHYGHSAANIESAFKANPRKFSHDAFKIWVAKHPKFRRNVAKGPGKSMGADGPWYDAIKSYYGDDTKLKNGDPNPKAHLPVYVKAVKRNAAKYRAAGGDAKGPQKISSGGSSGTRSNKPKIDVSGYSDSKKITGYGIANLFKIPGWGSGHNGFRSGIPKSKSGFENFVSDNNIKLVISMSGNGEGGIGHAAEREIVEKYGGKWKFINAHQSYGSYKPGVGYDESKELILAELNGVPAGDGFLIHCTGGIDRTGYTVASYLKDNGIVTNNEALWNYTRKIPNNEWGEPDNYVIDVAAFDKKGCRNFGYAKYLDTFYPIEEFLDVHDPDRKTNLGKHWPRRPCKLDK